MSGYNPTSFPLKPNSARCNGETFFKRIFERRQEKVAPSYSLVICKKNVPVLEHSFEYRKSGWGKCNDAL